MIEFRTKLDGAKSAALFRHSFKRIIWLPILFSAIFITIGVVSIVLQTEEGDLPYGIAMTVIGALFLPIVYLISKLAQKKSAESMSVISDTTEEIYTFDEDHITVTQQKGDEYYSQTKATYPYLYKAREDKDFFFLYISKMQCHVIDKNSITQGSIDEMRNLLAVQMGSKFKPMKCQNK
ncbi:MAG: YcxB family protein [Clostridia bacterium]|nr:YcxB family protein [Clostridia bacterium]